TAASSVTSYGGCSLADLGGSAPRGVGQAAKTRCDARDFFFVEALRELRVITALAMRLDHAVDEFSRLQVRIRQLGHVPQFRSIQSRSTIRSAKHVYS